MMTISARGLSTGITIRPWATRVATFLATFFLIMSVTPVAAQDRDHDWDHNRDRDHDREGVLRVSRESVVRDFGGGRGGRPSPDAVCDPGSVAVGFHVQTGEFYNEAWLDCAPLRPDGHLGDDVRITSRTGTSGGRPVHDAFCGRGRALRGLTGRTGASIDEASGECSYLRDIAERSDSPPTELTEAIVIPRPGGRPTETQCPAGFVVTGFRSMSGEYMDHLWIICSELRRSHDDH